MENYKVNRRAYARLLDMRSGGAPDSYILKTFLRLECYPEMLLFGKTKRKQGFAIRNALNFFSNRFPTFVIAIFSDDAFWLRTKRSDLSLPSKIFMCEEEGIAFLREKISKCTNDKFETEISWNQDFYETFFNASNIENRRNKKQQSALMKKEFFEEDSFEYKMLCETKRVKPNTSLNDFCKS